MEDTISEEELDEILEANSEFFIAENPVRESMLKIVKSDDDCGVVSIYDMTARLLYQKDNCGRQISIPVDFILSTGIYIVQVARESKTNVKRFLYTRN